MIEFNLKSFRKIDDILCYNYDDNRLFVYIDSNKTIKNLYKLKGYFPKFTLISLEPYKIDSKNILTKEWKKVRQMEHPNDPSVYNVLGKGFKDYDYYYTSLLFLDE